MMKNIIHYWKKVVIENYGNFSGRASRSEYWYFQLGFILSIVISLLLCIGLEIILKRNNFSIFISGLTILGATFGMFLPSTALAVRRLHDINKSGWWYLISFIPLIGFWLLVLYCKRGDIGENKFGPDPKNVTE